jgi:hypothetical protein
MAHEWIFEVLLDMRDYASKNGLPGLATQLEETLRVARSEIGAPTGGSASDDDGED